MRVLKAFFWYAVIVGAVWYLITSTGNRIEHPRAMTSAEMAWNEAAGFIRGGFTFAFYLLGLIVLVLLAFLAFAFVRYVSGALNRKVSVRPVEGRPDLLDFTGVIDRLFGYRRIVGIDTGQQVGYAKALVFHRGRLIYEGGSHQLTTSEAMEVKAGQQRLATFATLTGGMMRPSATMFKAAMGNYDKKTTPTVIVPPEPQKALPAPDFYEASQLVRYATADRLPFGQDAETGDVGYWDLINRNHGRAHGAPQMGKSSLIRELVVAARYVGMRVIVMERRRRKDFRGMEQHVEFVDINDPNAMLQCLHALTEAYQEDDKILGQYGASNVADLPEHARYPRTIIVIDEFMSALNTASLEDSDPRTETKNLEATITTVLGKLLSESGATGKHFIIGDHVPVGWPTRYRELIQNVWEFAVTEGATRHMEYKEAHRLAAYHCAFDGRVYRPAFIPMDEIPKAMAVMRRPPDKLLPVLFTNNGNIHAHTSEQPHEQRIRTAVEQMGAGANQSKWGDIIPRYIIDNPSKTLTEVARHMAALDGRPESYLNYKGAASPYWHTFNPAGNDYYHR